MESHRVLLAFGLACTGIFFSATRISSQDNAGPSLKVINRTTSFNVFGIKKAGSEVRLILKNNYNKSITAFSISVGGYGITRDLSHNGHLLAPGASYPQSCTISRSAGVPVITILSVVFDDRTSDGDSYAARAIFERRLGHRTQLVRIVQHLDNAQQASDNELSIALNATKIAIAHLPVSAQGNHSHHFAAGLHNAKEEALLELEELDHLRVNRGSAAARVRLVEITNDYRKRVARL